MLIEQTIEKLVQMKLHAMARSLKERLSRPDHTDLGVSDFVGLVVDDEWLHRQNRKVASRLKQARFKESQACLESLDYKTPRNLKKALVLELEQNHWLNQQQNIVITGPSGSGKSYLAQALGNHVCRSGYSVSYYRVSMLAVMFIQSRADGSYMRLLKKLSKAQLLILDDFGLGKLSEEQRNDLLEVIEDRYSQRSTLITSQLVPSEWHEYLGGGVIADAICDRLLHNSHRIDLLAPDSLRKLKSNLTRPENSDK
jgi:DNA replication protein DnaC